jgi:hypothetical protein
MWSDPAETLRGPVMNLSVHGPTQLCMSEANHGGVQRRRWRGFRNPQRGADAA